MKTLPAILVLTVVFAAVSCRADFFPYKAHTYVSNWSTRQIRATISANAKPGYFTERLIEPYAWDSLEYRGIGVDVDIEIWIEGNPPPGWAKIDTDRSIVAFDNGPAIDIYLVKFGSLIIVDDTHPEKLTTIYPW